MVFGRTAPVQWTLGTESIEQTDEYTHLGIIMTTRSPAKRRIEECMKKARRTFFAKCKKGINLKMDNPMSHYTTWRIYAEPVLIYSLAVTSLSPTDIMYLEGMLMRIYRLIQGLPTKTQKMVTYVMLGAPTCTSLVMRTALQFIGFLLRAAKEHTLTRYIITHGAVNADRTTSLVRQWDTLLQHLNLPSLSILANKKIDQPRTAWNKLASASVDQSMTKIIRNTAENMTSLFWLSLLPQTEKYEAPKTFWPASKYSAITRQATLTKIVLLTGHSLVATSMVRRHKETVVCPLCRNAIETLEHMLFECDKLKDDRVAAQKIYKTILNRTLPAAELIIIADKPQSLIIHYIYQARVRKELTENITKNLTVKESSQL